MPKSHAPVCLPTPPGLPAQAQLTLDAGQHLLSWTATARQIIRANPDCLNLTQGRLQLQPNPAPLADALRWICEPGYPSRREQAVAVHRLGATPLTLRLTRHHEPGTGATHAIVWLSDPDQFQLDEAALQQAFDFTPTEARVAVALAAGATTTELAQAWGLRANTVQMHVKRLLSKTHTARQAQLVGLLWRSAVLRLPTTPPGAAGVRACASHTPTQTGSDGAHPNSHTVGP